MMDLVATGDRHPACAVLVLNWNGFPHLRALLPSLEAAAARYAGRTRIVVVDNRSTEPDADNVRREFPGVEVVVAEQNDYLFSLNAVVATCPEPITIILNNDMRVDPAFIAPLLQHFVDPSVFAATANVYDWEGARRTTGQRQMALRRWWFYKWWDLTVERPVYTLDAGEDARHFVATTSWRSGGSIRSIDRRTTRILTFPTGPGCGGGGRSSNRRALSTTGKARPCAIRHARLASERCWLAIMSCSRSRTWAGGGFFWGSWPGAGSRCIQHTAWGSIHRARYPGRCPAALAGGGRDSAPPSVGH